MADRAAKTYASIETTMTTLKIEERRGRTRDDRGDVLEHEDEPMNVRTSMWPASMFA